METIRYTLKRFDAEHPDLAVFPENNGPLREETKRKIYQQFRRGESAESLAKKLCRTKTSIYRIVAEMRARRILELPLDYMPNEQFARIQGEEEKRILGPPPAPDQPGRSVRDPCHRLDHRPDDRAQPERRHDAEQQAGQVHSLPDEPPVPAAQQEQRGHGDEDEVDDHGCSSSIRIRLFPRPLLSVLTTRTGPTSVVVATCVPPSA